MGCRPGHWICLNWRLSDRRCRTPSRIKKMVYFHGQRDSHNLNGFDDNSSENQ